MNTIDKSYISEFVQSYLECAEWSELSVLEAGYLEAGEKFPYDNDGFSGEGWSKAREDCLQFIYMARRELRKANYNFDGYSNATLAGQDYWLTRNGHGEGFCDRGLGELGDTLAEKAKSFGSVYLELCHVTNSLTFAGIYSSYLLFCG